MVKRQSGNTMPVQDSQNLSEAFLLHSVSTSNNAA